MTKSDKHIKVSREIHSFLKIDALCKNVSINELVNSIFNDYIVSQRNVLLNNVKTVTGETITN